MAFSGDLQRNQAELAFADSGRIARDS